MSIIDRRLNPGGKSLTNRQRFIRRARAQVRQAVKEASASRSIKDMERGGTVTIPTDGVKEPTLRRAAEGGVRDYVLPGNREYVEGETIARPRQSSGSGREGGEDGGGEDEFRFALSDSEFMDLFLEDLELPDMAKKALKGEGAPVWRRAGYATSGSPANISIARTMRNSLSRRIALKRPKPDEIASLENALAELVASGADRQLIEAAQLALSRAKTRAVRIGFIDPLDVRYRRYEPHPTPIAQAVMFCVMDVSGSMTEHMKDLAKRFFTLLYIFLKRRYRHVEVVFIRHTHTAQEVDEETFFYARETGGTIVSTALDTMAKVITDRFPPTQWNIYAAQASDGDNTPSDTAKSINLMQDAILPHVQYFAYLEVGAEDEDGPIMHSDRATLLWRTYALVVKQGGAIAMRKVRHRREIFPVFRDLFQRQPDRAGAAGE